VCSPNSKGLRTRPRLSPTPCKNSHNQHRIKGDNPIEDLRPLIEQKIKEFGAFSEKLGFGWVGDKMGILGIWVVGGGWVGRRTTGGDVLVVGEVVGGGGCGWFWIWGGEGRRCGDGGGYGWWGKWGKKKKSDLKAGLDGPKAEYFRTYIGTFDRTRAGACVCEAACVRTYASTFERTRAVQWV
jgi:hypothetical protein